jgi:hypothetical protein
VLSPSSLPMLLDEICINPHHYMILESAFNDLVEKIRAK